MAQTDNNLLDFFSNIDIFRKGITPGIRSSMTIGPFCPAVSGRRWFYLKIGPLSMYNLTFRVLFGSMALGDKLWDNNNFY
jgi:hypothetical protein